MECGSTYVRVHVVAIQYTYRDIIHTQEAADIKIRESSTAVAIAVTSRFHSSL